jgi:hypothetical protein
VEAQSPELFSVLRDNNVKIEVVRWDGTPESIQTKEPSLVLASQQMFCTQLELATWCAKYGHLVFYNDIYINPYGKALNLPEIIDEIAFFLDNIFGLAKTLPHK